MKQLRLRQLAKPLKEARKDPEVDRAALFVERLLGRPMRSNPGVIIISDENRKEFLGLVDEDFPPTRPAFSPLSFLMNEQMKARMAASGAELFGFGDMLAPARTHNKINELGRAARLRRALVEAGGQGAPRKSIKWNHPAAGLCNYENDLVVSRAHNAGIHVHELIHSEDFVLFGEPKTFLDEAITEGRATFGDELYRVSANPEEKPSLKLESAIYMGRAMFRTGRDVFMLNVYEKGWQFAITDFLKFLKSLKVNAIDNGSVTYQLLYLPYATALMDLSWVLGDPFLAFQLATEKPPTAWKHILWPEDYYRADVERIFKARWPETWDVPTPQKNQWGIGRGAKHAH